MTNIQRPLNGDSLRDKILLLVVDKLVIGAIIAIAFVIYSRWQASDLRRFERAAQDRELSFRKAEYVRTLVPLVVSRKTDMRLRLQAFGALVDTRSIDGRSAVQLAQDLIEAGALARDMRGYRLTTSGTWAFLEHCLEELSPETIESSLDTYSYALTQYKDLQRDTERTESAYAAGELWSMATSFWQSVLSGMAVQFADSLKSPFDSWVLSEPEIWMDIIYPKSPSPDEYRRWTRSRLPLLRFLGNWRLLEYNDPVATSYIASVVDGSADTLALIYSQQALHKLIEKGYWSRPIARASLAVLLKGRTPSPRSKDSTVMNYWTDRLFIAGNYLVVFAASDSFAGELEQGVVGALGGIAERMRATSGGFGLGPYPNNLSAEGFLVQALVAADSAHRSSMTHASEVTLFSIDSVFQDHPEKTPWFDFSAAILRWHDRHRRS